MTDANAERGGEHVHAAPRELENLLESTGLPILHLAADGTLRFFTPALTELYEIDVSYLGASIDEVSTRLAYPELLDDLGRVLATHEPLARDVELAGSKRAFSVRAHPHVDGRSELGVVFTFLEISERRRYERVLVESAEELGAHYAELEALYVASPVGLALMDTELRWIRINETLAAINGFPVETHIGRRQDELLPEVDDEVARLMRGVLESGEPSLGNFVITETPSEPGVRREFLVDYYPVKTRGDVVALGCCVREVTRERSLERRLLENERRLGRLFDQAPAIIAVFEGPEHRYVYSNPLHDATVGGRPLIGRLAREAMPELEGQGIFARFDRVFASGNAEMVEELEAEYDTGEEGKQTRYFRHLVQPWYDDDDRVGGVMAFNYDLTDQVRAREEARASRARLQTLQDSLASFVGLLEPDGTLREANAPALERAGLEREDVIGRKFWDCHWWTHDADVSERCREACLRAAGGASVRYDEQVRMAEEELLLVDFQIVPSIDEKGRVTELIPSAIDITEQRRTEERRQLLLHELQHRVKNVLARVQSVARYSARRGGTKEEVIESLQRRLAAMARTHDALTRDDWAGRSLRALIADEIAPYAPAEGACWSYGGPDVQLAPATALSLGLAIHELATNAAKYGAFANSEGTIAVHVAATPAGGLARLEWIERGGPPVSPPTHSGFGSFLIQEVLGMELDAEIKTFFEPQGYRLVLQVLEDPES